MEQPINPDQVKLSNQCHGPAMSSAIIDLNTSIVEHEVLGHSVKFAILDGADDWYRDNLRRTPPHEDFNQYFLARSARKSATLKIVDGGANIGTISLPLAMRGFSVLAIEILPENISALIRAIIENNLVNITVAPIALYDRPASIGIFGFSAWGGVDLTGTAPNRCYADKLANVMLAYGFADADIVKIDIEGAELPALTDIEIITEKNDHVEFIFESNSHTCALYGYKSQDLVSRFEKLGFNCYYFRGQHLSPCSSKRVQPRIVEDILATRASLNELITELGYEVLQDAENEVLSHFERQTLETDSIHCHQHVARQIRLLNQHERQAPRIENLIAHLGNIEDAVIKFELAQAPGDFTLTEQGV
jgi:FkbM family methyltransferase